METKQRNAFDAAFKLNGIDLAATEGNRAAARRLGNSESMVRREKLSKCKMTTKACQKKKRWLPELGN